MELTKQELDYKQLAKEHLKSEEIFDEEISDWQFELTQEQKQISDKQDRAQFLTKSLVIV